MTQQLTDCCLAQQPWDFLFQNIFWPMISGIISTVVYIILSWLWRRPRLTFDIVQNDPAIDKNGVGYYHIVVENKGKTTAQGCRLSIEYKDYTSKHILTLNPGKWDKNPNPVAPIAVPDKTGYKIVNSPNSSLLHYSGELNIKADAREIFCYLIKYKSEADCYAFNADNFIEGFLTGQRMDSRKLKPGEYLITFRITGDNVESDATFLITNLGMGQLDLPITKKKGIYTPVN